jgi:DNA-directed RNA polymerase specialized sigma24 family protein
MRWVESRGLAESARSARQKLDVHHDKAPGTFVCWLEVIVRTITANVRRAYHRKNRNVNRERTMDTGRDGRSLKYGLSAHDPRPDEEAIRHEDAARLWAAVERFSAITQTVIRMRMIDNVLWEDIARHVGTTPEGARKIFDRASKLLASCWVRRSAEMLDGPPQVNGTNSYRAGFRRSRGNGSCHLFLPIVYRYRRRQAEDKLKGRCLG